MRSLSTVQGWSPARCTAVAHGVEGGVDALEVRRNDASSAPCLRRWTPGNNVGIEHHDTEQLAQVGTRHHTGFHRLMGLTCPRWAQVPHICPAGLLTGLSRPRDVQAALGIDAALVAGAQPAVGRKGVAALLGLL